MHCRNKPWNIWISQKDLGHCPHQLKHALQVMPSACFRVLSVSRGIPVDGSHVHVCVPGGTAAPLTPFPSCISDVCGHQLCNFCRHIRRQHGSLFERLTPPWFCDRAWFYVPAIDGPALEDTTLICLTMSAPRPHVGVHATSTMDCT